MSKNDTTSAVFCALHDQLASLGRHAQLTRCFSAVAELLVNLLGVLYGIVNSFRFQLFVITARQHSLLC